jgi:uncharacterized membrane protein YfhO
MAALSSRFQDLRERSVVEDPSAPNGPEIPGSEKSFAHVVKDLDQRVEIEVESDKGGVLVLADNMAPGWSVDVDGTATTAMTANYLFRGVVVPAGFHRVRWAYAAPGLRSGAIISICTVSGLLVMTYKRRPRGSAFKVVGTLPVMSPG